MTDEEMLELLLEEEEVEDRMLDVDYLQRRFPDREPPYILM